MKTHDLTGLDQHDAETLYARLQIHAANLRGMVHTADGQIVATPDLEGRYFMENIPVLEKHIGELEARLGDVAPAFSEPQPVTAPAETSTATPTAKKLTLTERVLLAKNGKPATITPALRSATGNVTSGTAKPKAKTLTDRVLEAKGVKSLDELNAKHLATID